MVGFHSPPNYVHIKIYQRLYFWSNKKTVVGNKEQKLTSSSSSWLVSVSWWRAHSRVVVFHTLHRGKRDTRLCPNLVYWSTLYPLLLPQLRESSFLIPLFYSSSPSLSVFAAAVAVSRAPSRSSPACSHHRIPTYAPHFLSAASHRSRIGRVTIYCATVFCLRRM